MPQTRHIARKQEEIKEKGDNATSANATD